MRQLVSLDYKFVVNKLKNKVFTIDGIPYQYSIEQRGSCLHIVELNFKPNTETTMSIPLPVYNQFVEWLNDNIMLGGMKGNDVMGAFIKIYEEYRRQYLGSTETLKPSSYGRYASVLFGFWKCMGGYMGFECKINPQEVIKTVTQEGETLRIESELLSRGYYIKPTKQPIVQIIDKSQSKLLEFAENGR